jgi:glycosyltransferase involved in cell wall biosynthesis
MRIAYFAHINGGPGSGVYQKIAGQVGRWRAGGHDVELLVFTEDDAFQGDDLPADPVVGRHRGPVSRLRVMSDLIGRIRRFDPDLVYWRQSLFYPPALLLPARAVVIIEIQSDDMKELALRSSFRSLYNRFTRGLLLGRADALVFVTPELSRWSAFDGYAARRYVIPNGIDLDAYPTLPAPADPKPRLAFVGSPGSPWHGVDRLVALAEARPSWSFDVVGYQCPDDTGPSNVTYHGAKDRAGVLDVLASAHVAVGSLALHRISIDQASTLKMREYLAVGIPVIYAGSDPDVDGLVPNTLRIPNTETGVIDDLARIDAFVDESRGRRVPRERVAHLHVARKEEQRLAVFEELVSGSRER